MENGLLDFPLDNSIRLDFVEQSLQSLSGEVYIQNYAKITKLRGKVSDLEHDFFILKQCVLVISILLVMLAIWNVFFFVFDVTFTMIKEFRRSNRKNRRKMYYTV